MTAEQDRDNTDLRPWCVTHPTHSVGTCASFGHLHRAPVLHVLSGRQKPLMLTADIRTCLLLPQQGSLEHTVVVQARDRC